jgi:hypothetical protein
MHMLNQIAVNPATENYTFTKVINLPVFAGNEITPAAMQSLRMSRIKDHVSAMLDTVSDAGFYLATDAQATLALLRASFKTKLDADQPLKAAILAAAEPFTIIATLASSQDGHSQAITLTIYVGTVSMVSETRVKALNSFVASDTKRLQLNGAVLA